GGEEDDRAEEERDQEWSGQLHRAEESQRARRRDRLLAGDRDPGFGDHGSGGAGHQQTEPLGGRLGGGEIRDDPSLEDDEQAIRELDQFRELFRNEQGRR